MSQDAFELLREFRAEIPEPGEEERARVLGEIVGAGRVAADRRRSLLRVPRGRVSAALAVGAFALVAAAVLLLLAPWQTGPAALTPAQAAAVLERALAAVSPTPGSIFHQKTEVTLVPAPGAGRFVTVVSETWKQDGAPYRFRLLNPIWQSPGIEVGGRTDPVRAFAYDRATDTLYRDDALAAAGSGPGLPVTVARFQETAERLRGAIKAGAPVTRMRVDGHDVYRIGTGTETPGGFDGWLYYVDAKSYAPVRIETPGFPLEQPGGRATPGGYAQSRKFPATRTVERVLAYEYLPPTPTALEAVDIEARHPGARTASAAEMPAALRTALHPLTFAMPTPTIDPAGAPTERLLVDVVHSTIGGLRLGRPLQAFMAAWPPPDEFVTSRDTLDPRYPAVALWRAHDALPWAAVDFRDQAAFHARSIYYRGPFRTSRGDRNGTPLQTFLEHWPDHRQPETSGQYTRVRVESSSFWFDEEKRLLAVQVGLGGAYTYAGFPR